MGGKKIIIAVSFLTSLGEHLTGTSGDLHDFMFIPKTLGHYTAFQFGILHNIFFSPDEEPNPEPIQLLILAPGMFTTVGEKYN